MSKENKQIELDLVIKSTAALDEQVKRELEVSDEGKSIAGLIPPSGGAAGEPT